MSSQKIHNSVARLLRTLLSAAILTALALPLSAAEPGESASEKKVAKRRAKRDQSIQRRQNKRNRVDVTHPHRKQFFTVTEKGVKNSEGFILKKVTNDYEGRQTKK